MNQNWDVILGKIKRAAGMLTGEYLDEEDSEKMNSVIDGISNIFMPNMSPKTDRRSDQVIVPDINALIQEVSDGLAYTTQVDQPHDYAELDEHVGASIEALIYAIVAYDMLRMLRPGRGAKYFIGRFQSICSGRGKRYEHAYVSLELMKLLTQIQKAVKVNG